MDAGWRSLTERAEVFEANCHALSKRDAGAGAALRGFASDRDYMVRGEGDGVSLGRRDGGVVIPIPPAVPPQAAAGIAARTFPTGHCTEPALVVGIDHGWLWQALYAMPCKSIYPGYRPPLYFAAGTLEELWAAAHLHDWRDLLADPRVKLFCGGDALRHMHNAMASEIRLPWPRLALTIDDSLWPAGMNLDSMQASARTSLVHLLAEKTRQLQTMDQSISAKGLAEMLRGGRKMRILGITSRYTTFLKHSMRDWLDAFESMGHETRLCIESNDHEVMSNLVYADACADFKPDLIVLIDHYRTDLGGLPQNVPCIMWVQDMMPALLTTEAGSRQGARDYTIGYGREVFTSQHGYPYGRFMPCMVGVNEKRFESRAPLSDAKAQSLACDASFVSHASTPADALLERALGNASPDARRVLTVTFGRLKGVYDQGDCIADPQGMIKIIDDTLHDLQLEVAPDSRTGLINLFSHQINNALFRHQSVQWVADMGVDLRLYGNGWDKHPKLSRYARGPVDHQTQLSDIYRASKINLHISPHGAVHQRVFEGLCAGGFFLLRYRDGDAAGIFYKPILDWCRRHGIVSDSEFRTRATSGIWRMVREAQHLRGRDLFNLGHSFMEELNLLADSDYTLAGATLWDNYPDIAFASKMEIEAKVTRYLANNTERDRIAAAMRKSVLDKLTYRRTTERLLAFIALDLESQITRDGVMRHAA